MAHDLADTVLDSSSRFFHAISELVAPTASRLQAQGPTTTSFTSLVTSTLAHPGTSLHALFAWSVSFSRRIYIWSIWNPQRAVAYLVVSVLVLYPSLSVIQDIISNAFPGSSAPRISRKKRMQWPRSKKREGRYTVGLINRANDCFANSNLQALASLRFLYEYCTNISGLMPHPGIQRLYLQLVSSNQNDEKSTRRNAVANLTTGPLEISIALKSEIVQLNEPILEPKELDPWTFLHLLERFYSSRIPRSQHDAHELLHLILETLEIEHRRLGTFYKAMRDDMAQSQGDLSLANDKFTQNGIPKNVVDLIQQRYPTPEAIDNVIESIPPFPFKGNTRDQITCSRCGYIPSSSTSSFIVLSLIVPQRNRATLSDLLVDYTKPEHILDYGCTNCRLVELIRRLKHSINLARTPEPTRVEHTKLLNQLEPYLQNPSTLPQGLEDMLPKDVTSAISKATSFDVLPEVLTIHLNRSIFWSYGASRNSCKVSVPEYLELFEEGKKETKSPTNAGESVLGEKLNSLLTSRRKVQYMLVAVIRHSGTHQAGHYECFRRKNLKWWRSHVVPVIGGGSVSHSESGAATSSVSSSPGPASKARMNSNESSSLGDKTSIDEQQDGHSISATGSQTQQEQANDNHTDKISNTTNTSLQDFQTQQPSSASRPVSSSWFFGFGLSSISSALSLDSFGYAKEAGSNSLDASSTSSPNSHDTHQANGSNGSDPAQPLSSTRSTESAASRSSMPATAGLAFGQLPSNVLPPSVNNDWWQISDESSWEKNIKDVLKDESGAYLLFYEKISK